jgi:hypothetical protein
MLQARMRDMLLITSGGNITDTYGENYYEPGFNIMSPLEFEFPRCDRLSLGIRKRADAEGISFSDIAATNMTTTVIDPTNGQNIPYTLTDDTSTHDDTIHLILNICNSLTLNNTVVRVRVMDVCIKDTTDDDFLVCRISVDDQDKYFNYIFVDLTNMADRSTFTASGRDICITVNSSSNYYLLFSPYAYLTETISSDANFAYPLNTIFYKRQNTYNNEDYTFSISSYSHTFMNSVVSVMNVPSYGKAGVLLVDNKLYKDMISNGVNPYIDISVIGELSGISDIFRVNFKT